MSALPECQPEVVPVERSSGIYLVLDPNQSNAVRPPSGGIEKVTYQVSGIPTYFRVKRYRLVNIIFASDLFNIVDYSAFNGLKNNVLLIDGHTVTIPPGNWDINSLITYLQTEFNTVDPGKAFVITYSPISLAITITANSNFTLDLSGPFSPWYELGFDQLSYTSSMNTLSSISAIDLAGPVGIFVNCPEIYSGNTLIANSFSALFYWPLCGATPSVSQGSIVSLGKVDAYVSNLQCQSQMTIALSYLRAGTVYPLIDKPLSSYQIVLGLYS